MKRVIKEDDKSVIIREGNRVIKTFGSPRLHMKHKHWLLHYEAFTNMYGGVVKVHEADENHIVMDYVEGKSVDRQLWRDGEVNHQFSYQTFAAILQLLANMAEYSSMISHVWYHCDAGTHNLTYTGKEFILTDPDSFVLTKNPYPGSFVSSLHPLHNILKVLHTMHQTNYEKNE